MDLAALRTEITTDPSLRGYAMPYVAGNDAEVARLLNEPRGTYQHPRGVVPAHAVVAAIAPGEFAALSAAERTWLTFLVSVGSVDLASAVVRGALGALFPANSTTRPRLLALATRDGSRADELGLGTVSDADVARARRLV